jgi:hypothetical protein
MGASKRNEMRRQEYELSSPALVQREVRNAVRTPIAHSAIEWTEYPSIPPGEYSAYCVWAGKYYDPVFKRWTCLLRFDVMSENRMDVVARIPMWLSLGEGEKPRASMRSKYLSEWVKANGGRPARGDRLSPQVFAHRVARVEIGDTTRGPIPYSVVKKILHWETGKSGHSVSKSYSQGRQRETTEDE